MTSSLAKSLRPATGQQTEQALTASQRASAAAQAVADQFHLADTKRVLVALAEIAGQEMQRNPDFAARVCNRYVELAPLKKQRATSAQPRQRKPARKEWPDLVPIKQIPGFQPDVSRPLDPYFILEYFGAHQLQTALERQPLNNLKQAIAIVEERSPGARYKGKVTTAKVVTFIIEHILSDTEVC